MCVYIIICIIMNKEESLVDMAASAGVLPEGVALSTWLIAKLPPGPLTHAAKSEVPSYEQLVEDKVRGGQLLKYMDENPMPEKALGTDILLKQQELSRSRRWLATLACSATLFAGGTTYAYDTITKVDQSMKIETTTVDRVARGAILGVPAGVLGGFVTFFVSLGQANRLARGPARRIVKRAEKEVQE